MTVTDVLATKLLTLKEHEVDYEQRARDRAHAAASRSTGTACARRPAESPYAKAFFTLAKSSSSRRPAAKRLEGRDLAPLGETAQRLGLELAHALARDAEDASDLLERLRLSAPLEAVAQVEDLLLALAESSATASCSAFSVSSTSTCSSGVRLVAREQVAERRRVVLADGLVERRDRARCSAHLAHLLDRQLRLLGELLLGRRALQRRDELALGARDLLLALDDVHRDADRARLVRDAALHGLADPPRRVRRELEALAPVELLGGADQPDDPLLDQVEERQAVTLVLLRDRDDEPQVRVDEQVLRLLVAPLDRASRSRPPARRSAAGTGRPRSGRAAASRSSPRRPARSCRRSPPRSRGSSRRSARCRRCRAARAGSRCRPPRARASATISYSSVMWTQPCSSPCSIRSAIGSWAIGTRYPSVRSNSQRRRLDWFQRILTPRPTGSPAGHLHACSAAAPSRPRPRPPTGRSKAGSGSPCLAVVVMAVVLASRR